MAMSYQKLMAPLTMNGMTVPNRMIVPAMVTRLSGDDGFVNQAIIDRYVRFAQGHVGLIVVEATAIHESKSGPLLRLSDDKFIAGHKELVARVHEAGPSKIVPQIIHFMKVARSGWRQTLDMLSTDEMTDIIRQFGEAALRVREAGYDGVELHAAHAYTLASSLSRLNRRRDHYDGRTLEGRLRMFGEVFAEVRAQVGEDFPVGVRFLADEMIKDGYTLEDSRLIALRMAQLGCDYISLSVGGKFEDAIPQKGRPPYPYTGYSGDRCMPGAHYPAMPHIEYPTRIRKYLRDKGYQVPVVAIGKISAPEDAERVLEEGRGDMIGMARQLLADPDWPKKVSEGRTDEILRCIYCNVCKQLDENFKPVTCFLWPKGNAQAPRDDPHADRPAWPEGNILTARIEGGMVRLNWPPATGPRVLGYDIYRAEDRGEVICIEAKKSTKFDDRTVLGGLNYTYYVRAFGEAGTPSLPSNSVSVDMPWAAPSAVSDLEFTRSGI